MRKELREPLVTVVVATHNRREVVAHSLSEIRRCGLEPWQYEIILVDNHSNDGTRETLAAEVDLLVSLKRNRGSCAKAYGIDRARGRYIVFLDDDSYPRPGTLTRLVEKFEADPRLGAAGFTVHLPDGRREGGALPGVFVGCGAGLRATALRGVGGLDRTFFMQAEEYDLAFRLVSAGWTVKVFDDLHVEHQKTERSRLSERTTFYDVRNNLRIIARYVPAAAARIYREDCLQRYEWLASLEGHEKAYKRGVRVGRRRSILERWTYRRRRLAPGVFEHFYRWAFIRRRMAELAESGVRRIALASVGKNVFPFVRAARDVGIRITGIGDDRFALPGRCYRGVPVVSMEEALSNPHDAVVVADAGPEHAARVQRAVVSRATRPVHCWFTEDKPAFFDERDCPASTEVSGGWRTEHIAASAWGSAGG